MKNLSFSQLASRWSLLIIVFVGCVLSCEENAMTNDPSPKKEELVVRLDDQSPIPIDNRRGVTTCANEKDRLSCDSDLNGYCECTGSNCSRYCYDITYTPFRLIERGRICGSTAGCLVPNIEELILYFHIEKLIQPLSVLMTEKKEIFAKSYLISYDEKEKIATIGYSLVNADLAKNELFIHINTNFISESGKFTSLNLLSEAIPPGHFQRK